MPVVSLGGGSKGGLAGGRSAAGLWVWGAVEVVMADGVSVLAVVLTLAGKSGGVAGSAVSLVVVGFGVASCWELESVLVGCWGGWARFGVSSPRAWLRELEPGLVGGCQGLGASSVYPGCWGGL